MPVRGTDSGLDDFGPVPASGLAVRSALTSRRQALALYESESRRFTVTATVLVVPAANLEPSAAHGGGRAQATI